jgi:hypothetical protein
MNPLARARMRSRFDVAAIMRPDIGPPATSGYFPAGTRAVNALKRTLSGRTLQALIDR